MKLFNRSYKGGAVEEMGMDTFGITYLLSSFIGSFFAMCLGVGLPISIAIIVAVVMLKKKD